MIKLGFSATGFQGKDLWTTVDCISKAGYQAIEMDAAQLDLQGDKQYFDDVRAQVAAAGLTIESLRWYGPNLETMGFEVAAALNAPLIATGTKAREGDKDAFAQEVQVFKTWTEIAARHEIKLCVKAHINMYLHDTPTTIQFLDAVDSEYLGLMWDPSHLWRANEDPADMLAAVIGHIFCVRLRDHKGRQKPVDPAEIQIPGNGGMNWPRILSQLKQVSNLSILTVEINQMQTWQPEQMLDVLTRARQNMERFL